jgi:signal transduction histidine kinase
MGGGRPGARGMAHQDPRDLVDATRGRGYAERVSPALPAWLGNPSSRLVDAAVTVVVGVPVVATTIADAAADERPLLGLLFGLAAVAPLLVRRRWPFAALAAILAVAFSSPADGAFELPVLVAVYTIGSSRSWEATAAAAAAVVAAAAVYEVAGGPDLTTEDVLGLALLCSIAAGLGLYVGSRRTSMEALRERAERLDRERELLAERAVAEERVRIAQELHDVVAHNVSLIVVQAQALGATVPDDRVTEATDGIADLGRQAMAEMHRTLKLLRANEDEAVGRGPQPGLRDLDRLMERARAAGVRVELAVEGEPRTLSQSVDLSAYRIVQEALTNVVKHAGRAHTTVTLGYRADALELTITDSGDTALSAGVASPGGHGLVGMRERAALFGGKLTAGPRGDHGFEVHALLPYGERSPA